LEKDDAEIIVAIGAVGFDFERLFVMSNSLNHLSLVEKSIAKIVVDFGVVGFDFERLINTERLLRPT
jgi:hypothetical protein